MPQDLDPDTLAKVRNAFEEDIRWTILEGPGWDPGNGARLDHGKWQPSGKCSIGTCAVGAMVCHRQLCATDDHDENHDDVGTAATYLGVPYEWMEDLYLAVGDAQGCVNDDCYDDDCDCGDDYTDQIWSLAVHLNEYALTIKKPTV